MQPLLGYEARFAAGILITLAVAAAALLLAVVLGLLGATAKLSTGKIVRRLATVYTTVVARHPRATFYFGGVLRLATPAKCRQ